MQFTAALNTYQLSDVEMGLFSGAILLNERQGLSDVKAIQRLQERLLEALRIQIVRKLVADNDSNESQNDCTSEVNDANSIKGLSQKIPELKALGLRHANILDWFRRNWAKLKLPPLFAEIFDIPKCEEDLQ